MRTPEQDGRVTELLREHDRGIVELAELGVDIALARPGTPASLDVVMIRLEALERAISSRDWREVERGWSRVRASLDKAMAGGAPRGVNGRPVR